MLGAIPAATCTRQVPDQPLGRGPASAVVHALVGDLTETLCRTLVRGLDMWDGTPRRLCSLCATAIGARHYGPFWKPTALELGELHLTAALALVATVRERLADIRSESIADGSGLLIVERLHAYRQMRQLPDDAEVPPLHAATILGQLIDRLVPSPTAAAEPASVLPQALLDRAAAATAERRMDLRAARAAAKAAAR